MTSAAQINRGRKQVTTAKFGVLFIVSLVQAVFWWALLQTDPFGMSTASDNASEQVFLRLYPVIYPGEWRDRIQVVILDNSQLPLTADPDASREWPLKFEEHTNLIREIVALKPKAVFIDFLFDEQTDRNVGAFADLIAGLPPDGPPVVFAAYSGDKKRLIKPLQERPFEAASGGGSVLRGLVELIAPVNHYQLADGKGGASAAAVVYNATVDTLNREAKPGDKPYEKVDTAQASDMLVAWGNTVPPADAASTDCAPITDASDSRWNGLASAIGAGITNAVSANSNWDHLQPCSYHRRVHPKTLLLDDESSAERLLERETITGSYVFIGAAIDGAGDTVVSPVHGKLSGVFLHAMALDNLLSFRGSYFNPANTQTKSLDTIVQVAMIFLCYLFGRWVFADKPPPSSRLAAIGWFGKRIGAWLGVAIMAIALLLLSLANFGSPPYVFNWGSVLAVASVVFFADAGRALIALVRGS